MAPERGAVGGGAATEGLPRAFLQSLRTLFDILDDGRRGYVHVREIESRWLQQGGKEESQAPRGVLEALRRAAPASGRLTFERFVLGLRASLLSPERPAGGRGAPEKVPTSQAAQGERAGGDSSGRKPAGPMQNKGTSKAVGEARRQLRGRGEQRRHTITHGVDYDLLKQMKELEKKKDFLLQGLEMVERAQEWYHQQIGILQERQKQLSKSKFQNDLLAEGAQTPLGHVLPKLQELNRCLCELLSLSVKPLSPCSAAPSGPACAPVSSPPLAGPQQVIHMLKEQNRLLTQEVTDKSERITQLEQEKSALIKQLFEAKSSREANLLDSTFI